MVSNDAWLTTLETEISATLWVWVAQEGLYIMLSCC